MAALRGLGTQRAWERMMVEVPHAGLIERLVDHDLLATGGSLNDVDAGSDTHHTVTFRGRRYVRDPRVWAEVLLRAGGFCERYGAKGFVTEARTLPRGPPHSGVLSRRSGPADQCHGTVRGRKALNIAMTAKVAALEGARQS